MLELNDRIATVEAAQRSNAAANGTSHSPALWNDIGRAPLPPRPAPATILRAVGGADEQGAVIGDAIGKLGPTVQQGLLRGLGVDAIVGLMLADNRALPAPGDRESYYADDDVLYWLSGLGDALLLADIGDDIGWPAAEPRRLLDFGCSSGRVVRHLAAAIPGAELWGVDLGLHNTRWARLHLPAEIVIAQNTTLPSLPFEDKSLDAIFAGSVFTHISDFEEAWLLELRRILRPGGWALVTFHPERVWDGIRDDPEHVLRRMVLDTPHRMDPPGTSPVTDEVFAGPVPAERIVFTNLVWPVNNTNVVHSHAWVRTHWGRVMTCVKILEGAHGGHQDGVVLQRSED